jgi:hypothetical protein
MRGEAILKGSAFGSPLKTTLIHSAKANLKYPPGKGRKYGLLDDTNLVAYAFASFILYRLCWPIREPEKKDGSTC